MLGILQNTFQHFSDIIGRNQMMMLSNVPLLIATRTWDIFIANALLGLGSGMLEAPVIAYVGEIGEPEFRSFLMAYAIYWYDIWIINRVHFEYINAMAYRDNGVHFCTNCKQLRKFSFEFKFNFSTFLKIVKIFNYYFLWLRFQNLQYGCYRRIDQKKH